MAYLYPLSLAALSALGILFAFIIALLALRARVAQWLEGETLHGTLWRAGLPKTLREPA